MAVQDLGYTSLVSGTGWTNPANVATDDNNFATDGDAGEAILIELDNAPGDYNDTNIGNTVVLKVRARKSASGGRPKQVTLALEDNGGSAILDSGSNPITFTTADLGTSEVEYTSSPFTLPNNYTATNVNGWRLRVTAAEGGGMPAGTKVEIDRQWLTLNYAVAVTDRQAEVSFAELEAPNAPRKAEVSFAELETPDAARKAELSWTEFEAPTAPRAAEVSFAELEAPTAPRRGEISFAELETPDVPRSAEVSFTEFEVPTAPRQAELSFAELEVPAAPARAEISWAELQVPNANIVYKYLTVLTDVDT